MSATSGDTDTTSSISYEPLSGPSLAATVPASGRVLVILTARITAANSQAALMSFSVSGTGGVEASDETALYSQSASSAPGDGSIQASASYLVSGLSAESHTFAAQYRSTTGVASFTARNIIVIPMP